MLVSLMKIFLIIPAFNEEGRLYSTIKKINKKLVSEIVIVDDGSKKSVICICLMKVGTRCVSASSPREGSRGPE